MRKISLILLTACMMCSMTACNLGSGSKETAATTEMQVDVSVDDDSEETVNPDAATATGNFDSLKLDEDIVLETDEGDGAAGE